MGTPAGRWVLVATISGSGMAMLDATVVNIALPAIGRDLGADFRALQWIVVVVSLRQVPESSDALSPPGLDVAGSVLIAVGLAGMTYALTSLGEGAGSGGVAFAAAVGTAALVAFVLVERRSPHPLVPLALFADRRFSVTNAVTLLVYAGLGVFFFLLVLQLQIVAGFSPLVAGTAMLPVTVPMLLLSSRAGALAERIGPRLPMTVGPLLAALGFLMTLRIGAGASYLLDVLPAVVVLGLGLSLTVAPLTATVLGLPTRATPASPASSLCRCLCPPPPGSPSNAAPTAA